MSRAIIRFSRTKLKWADSSSPFFLLGRRFSKRSRDWLGVRRLWRLTRVVVTTGRNKTLIDSGTHGKADSVTTRELTRDVAAISPRIASLGWRDAIERTVAGLHYELVDVERAPRGLLRITLDRVQGQSYPTGDSEFITVDDCEKVTRQLQYVLEVEGLAYERLEVSSPGLDRPLKREADYERFSGQAVNVTLKIPFQGRKTFKGVLARAEAGWSLVFNDGKQDQVLAFALDEVREARLVPVVDFKGRQTKKTGTVSADAAAIGVDGDQV
jgi:ribosome maturation factor RimP